ncbi:hypothetical protein ACLBYD_30025 [Rhodococcus sp. C26F]
MLEVQRILDIDLDFFVTPVVHYPQSDERPLAEDYSVWPVETAIEFLRNKFGLTGRLPGILTENHGDLFFRWREAIADGVLVPPFRVTHLDAHADLGLGDSGYKYLMTSLLSEPPEDRQQPRVGATGLNDGNFLLFAIACRWIHDLTYVYGEGGGSDELFLAMKGFKRPYDYIQLAAMDNQDLQRLISAPTGGYIPVVSHLEPEVPYQASHWDEFQAEVPFDFICLTRSPVYTPSTADLLYDAISAAFIAPVSR